MQVPLARVGGVQRLVRLAPTVAVVGQADVDLAGLRMHRHPLRSVHWRGAEMVRRGAGVEQHLGLAGEAVGRRQAVLAKNQRQPAPATIGVETRNIQRALVQQVAIGRGIIGLIAAGRDELVDVLALGVVAVVEGHTVVGAEGQGRALAAEAADCGAFLRRALRVEGIDFHHPAETVRLVDVAGVGLVGVWRGVEAWVNRFPGVVVAGTMVGDSVAPVGNPRGVVILVAVDEVLVPVFLADQIGAPWRDAHRAIVEGAEHRPPVRVAGGLHRLVPGQRTAQLHRRAAGDAPVVGRTGDALPLAGGVIAHLDHTQAVGGDLLAHLVRRPATAAIGALLEGQAARVQGLVDGFVVDHQQAVAVGVVREGEVVHAVVVVAGLQFLGAPVVRCVRTPGRRAGKHRVAPGEERPRAVAFGDHHTVELRVLLHRHALEAEQRRRLRPERAGRNQAAAEEAERAQRQAALEQAAPALVHQFVQRRVGSGVDRLVVERGQALVEVVAHRISSELRAPTPGIGSGRLCRADYREMTAADGNKSRPTGPRRNPGRARGKAYSTACRRPEKNADNKKPRRSGALQTDILTSLLATIRGGIPLFPFCLWRFLRNVLTGKEITRRHEGSIGVIATAPCKPWLTRRPSRPFLPPCPESMWPDLPQA
ncbi:hypothetical protein D3C78_553680 [compost metagenome]